MVSLTLIRPILRSSNIVLSTEKVMAIVVEKYNAIIVVHYTHINVSIRAVIIKQTITNK